MEKELDLTLRLGLPSPTVETHLSLSTHTTDQGNNVDGNRHFLRNNDVMINDEEGGRNNVDVNYRCYNLVFSHFAGIGETLNFAPFPVQPPPAPAPETATGSDYVLLDVPARRAHRNTLAFQHALDANANIGQCWGCSSGCLARRVNEMRKCTNLNCNAINTPMWRKGPLGPKSLCNACGIKFRKEEEKRCNGTE